jgi:hypothetical protein
MRSVTAVWNVAIIWPVAKVGTPSGPSDFRPISIVSVLSKAFELILHDQVLQHVNLSQPVVGFSVCFLDVGSALVRVTEDLRSAKAEGKVTVHVLQSF